MPIGGEEYKLLLANWPSGVTIVTWRGTETSEESKDDVRHGPVSYFADGNVFAIADGPDVLKDLLNRRGDEEATPLASSALYRTIRDKVGRRGDLIAYANADELWKVASAAAGEDEEQMLTITRALGSATVPRERLMI